MAYDKILVIHGRLDKRITYALNEAKSTVRRQALADCHQLPAHHRLPGYAKH